MATDVPGAADAELARDLARLREGYGRKLPDKLARLAALMRAAREGEGREPLAQARELAHTLKGTSGSYGFHATSEALLRIEEALERLLEAGPSGSASAWVEIERDLARAREQVGPHLTEPRS